MGSSLSVKTTLNLRSCSVFHRQLCMAEGRGKSRGSFFKLYYLSIMFIFFIYLPALGLSCSRRDLCCVMQDLLLWLEASLWALRLQFRDLVAP